MSGRYHVYVTLPDGQIVCADHRSKIVPVIRRYYARPTQADLAEIVTWWQHNAILSENCRNGRCEHHVV